MNTRTRIFFYRIEELTCQTDCDYYKIKLSEQNWHIMAESILSASYSAENDFAPGRYNMILTKKSCPNSLLVALEQNKDSVDYKNIRILFVLKQKISSFDLAYRNKIRS